jgi:N-acetylated-alpha-linked acidic dipeptidase
MADAEVLPYNYEAYGKEVVAYLDTAHKRAQDKLGAQAPDFGTVNNAAHRFEAAGARILARQKNPPANVDYLNHALLAAERALLIPEGLPHRPWYRHAIYAPGEYTGYAAVVIPGVNEALDQGDAGRVREELSALAAALNRAAKTLEDYR